MEGDGPFIICNACSVWPSLGFHLTKLTIDEKCVGQYPKKGYLLSPLLPAYLPQMQKSNVISDDGPKVSGAQGINPNQFLSLIDLLDHFIGDKLPQSLYPSSPWILSFKAIILAVLHT